MFSYKLENQCLPVLEQALESLRGYISKPPKNKKVVFLFSGGLDSVATAARLIIDYDYELFPIFINRKQSNLEYELDSVSFYGEMFRNRFPDNFHAVEEIIVNIPPSNLARNINSYVESYGYPFRDNLFALYSIYYAISLWSKHGQIFDIYTSTLPEDTFPHCSLEALRSSTLLACSSTPFKNWNITSPNIDPYLNDEGQFFGKKELVETSNRQGISLDLSRTCISAAKFNCGTCILCKRRRDAFKRARVQDSTRYEN